MCVNKVSCTLYNCKFSLFFFNRECPDADSGVSRLISKINVYANTIKPCNLMKLNLHTVPAIHNLSHRGFSIFIAYSKC